MQEKIEFLSHKNKKVIYADHAGRKGKNYAKKIARLTDDIVEMSKKKKYPLLVDITGSVIDKDVVEEFIKAAIRVKPVVTKIAVLGVVGIKKTLAKVVEKTSKVGFKTFDTTEEALDWLVRQ